MLLALLTTKIDCYFDPKKYSKFDHLGTEWPSYDEQTAILTNNF